MIPTINMSASEEASPVNGHVSPTAEDNTVDIANGFASDSDLSDVSDVRHAEPDVPSPDSAGPFIEKPEVTLEGASDSDNDNPDDDADFDMADTPVSVQSDGDRSDAAVDDSRPSQKRKAALEDEFMRENPELYGLRRSVCFLQLGREITTRLTRPTVPPNSTKKDCGFCNRYRAAV